MRRHLFLMLVFLGSVAVVACGSSDEGSVAPAAPGAPAAAPVASPADNTIKMVGSPGQYKYVPAEFSFKVGDTATFTLVGDPELHTFDVAALGVSESVAPNESHTFSLTFSSAGVFDIVCVPHPEMKGKITVE